MFDYRIVDDTTPLISLMKIVDEIKGRQVAKQMGLHLMGTVGMLRVAYEEKMLSYEGIIECIEVLKVNGRHISDKLFSQLLESIQLR